MKKPVRMVNLWILLLTASPLPGFTQDSTKTYSDTIFCGDANIIFNERNKNILPGISLVHVHENERTAVEAANWLLDSVNYGCFVTWQSRQQRFVNFSLLGRQYRFDPNRIYTLAGVASTLKSYNGTYSDSAANAVRIVADTFLKKYITGQSLVVALHNNTNAGGLSINSYKRGAIYSGDAKAVFVNPRQDPDDFFYTTESALFNFLKFKKYNVVLQDSINVKDDGSLSVYCGNNRIPYINIEAQDGHLQQQKKMLSVIWEKIRTMPRPEFFEKPETY